ncbi:hypothetical protein MalM25_17320 [Planctomycetes bacterium MalM25]|nr:hypothetical protein MalM25_17320 [Planctomycetes bacterium MalM25]
MRSFRLDSFSALATVAAVCSLFFAAKAMGKEYRTVALTGQAAPGAVGDFDGFQAPQLRESGLASFASSAQGVPGIWAESGGGLGLVALAGATDPGAGGGVDFTFFEAPVTNEAGTTAFVGFLNGSGVNLNNNTGLWSNAGGSLNLLARAGAAAPGTAGGAGGSGGGVPGTLTTSQFQPIVDLDNLDELDVGGGSSDTIRPLQRTASSNRVLGQSFTPSSTKTLDSIVLLADTAESFDSNTHVLQLAIFEQTTPDDDGNQQTDPGGDTQITSVETFDLAGLSWGEDTFLTLNLNSPVEITGGQEHHFEFWFTTEDNSHNISFDRSQNVGSSVATNGIMVVSQISATDPPPSFPIGDAISVDGGGGNRDLDYGFIYSSGGGGVLDSFAVLGSPVINQQGRTAFFATLNGGDVIEGADDNGIWAQDTNGDLQLVVRAGDDAPGVSDGSKFSLLSSRPALSDDGRLTFQSTLAGSAITQSNASGIWSEDASGDIQLVARAGESAPGTPADFAAITEAPSVNSQAQIAFIAGLSGTGVAAENNYGLWSNRNGVVTLIAREGDPAPGLDGETFAELSNSLPVLGDGGELAFRALLAGDGVGTTNNASLWKDSGAGPLLLAREGDEAEGVSDGASYLRFEDDLLVNAEGQAAFMAALKGAGVNSANNLGLWAEDTSGALHLVVRLGDSLDVDGSSAIDERTITEIALLSRDNALAGSSPAFNSDGGVAFYAAFDDDSSGVFIADLSTFSLNGDYNQDGVVDAADYTVWRDNNGAAGPVGDGTGPGLDGVPDGIVDQHDYELWKANYGAPSISVVSLSEGRQVPEPLGSQLLIVVFCWLQAGLRPPSLGPFR